ncbi:CAAX amino terminal protease self- immunity [Streptomyces sp. YIM 130001]|uniref:CPBP family intramembrane glutamic endopeptidase n=1 Tax=Streptomyces sp. YIM 130001 TaxID=2259644 RepID=UPI000E654536|nr:type II CAAX endopeptidase family protein [Streptomyces sp. YIM 130001]RII06835.1 CAAX amino terminal protease self- immunity [Streptomyces sp. YIM 130001]
MPSELEGSAPSRSAVRTGASLVRAWPAGACIVALGACAVFPVGPGVPVRMAVVGLAVVLLIAWAGVLRSAEAIRVAVFVGPLFGCFAVGMLSGWPPAVTTVLVCVLPLGCLLIAGRHAALKLAAPWLTRGSLTTGTLWLGLATVVLSAAALATWALVVRPEPAEYLRELQRLPLGLAILGIVAFALVNPVWEEMLFRGVLLTELAAVWGNRVAVALQAVLFGAAHFAGFPSGVIGMIMAASWGFVLGVIRVRSGGILIPYLVHVTANAVIGTLAVLTLG